MTCISGKQTNDLDILAQFSSFGGALATFLLFRTHFLYFCGAFLMFGLVKVGFSAGLELKRLFSINFSPIIAKFGQIDGVFFF